MKTDFLEETQYIHFNESFETPIIEREDNQNSLSFGDPITPDWSS